MVPHFATLACTHMRGGCMLGGDVGACMEAECWVGMWVHARRLHESRVGMWVYAWACVWLHVWWVDRCLMQASAAGRRRPHQP